MNTPNKTTKRQAQPETCIHITSNDAKYVASAPETRTYVNGLPPRKGKSLDSGLLAVTPFQLKRELQEARNHADKLAEALRMAIAALQDNDIDESMAGEFEILTDALAEYQNEKGGE